MELKIAILGTRGVPNNYGGFEHIAGYLSRGLVERGHDVTVPAFYILWFHFFEQQANEISEN